jgi:hypothetical protein
MAAPTAVAYTGGYATGGYAAVPSTYASGSYFTAMPNYSTQPGFVTANDNRVCMHVYIYIYMIRMYVEMYVLMCICACNYSTQRRHVCHYHGQQCMYLDYVFVPCCPGLGISKWLFDIYNILDHFQHMQSHTHTQRETHTH